MAVVNLYATNLTTLSSTSAAHTHVRAHSGLDGEEEIGPAVRDIDLYTFDGSSETLRVSSIVADQLWHLYGDGDENLFSGTWTPGATIDLTGANDKLRLKMDLGLYGLVEGWISGGVRSLTDDTGGRGILQTTQITCYVGIKDPDMNWNYSYCDLCVGNVTRLNPDFVAGPSYFMDFSPYPGGKVLW